MHRFFSLFRVHQYFKNAFVLCPLFFAGKFSQVELVFEAVLAALAFSLICSAVYVFNDILDVESDRNHPVKKGRPLAANELSMQAAWICLLALLPVGFASMYLISPQASFVAILYLTLNVLYSLWLKHIAILDVTIISVGFVLRLFIGALVVDVVLSSWIILMTFLLALFLALAKRRDDVLIYNETGEKLRKTLDGYNLVFIDAMMVMAASVMAVSYILYTTTSELVSTVEGEYLYLTAFFVVLGIMRYFQLTFVFQKSGSPTQILVQDRFTQLNLLAWVALFVWILY